MVEIEQILVKFTNYMYDLEEFPRDSVGLCTGQTWLLCVGCCR